MNKKQRSLSYGTLLGTAGILLSCLTVSAGEITAVIVDPTWTIEIRPGQREMTSSPMIATPRSNVVPAVYQEPGPTLESVRKQAVVGEQKPIGPELPPERTPQPAVPLVIPRMTYAQAYAAVPFSRTEYEANPVYRHQAALELMFGVLRPMTLNQQYMPRAFRYPDFYQYPYAHSGTQNIDIHQWGGGYNYGGFNGQSPFGYPYGLRGNW